MTTRKIPFNLVGVIPVKYRDQLIQIAVENPDAYSVMHVWGEPGGLGYHPTAQITFYSDEPAAAASRFYQSLQK